MGKKANPHGITEPEWKRKKGMDLLRSGMKQMEVVRKLGVARRTVYEWNRRLENHEDFRNRKKSGRKPRLSSHQKEELKNIIDAGALKYGLPTDLWTLKRIARVIEEKFHVHYNTTYIWQILDALHYSAQMPMPSQWKRTSPM